MQERTFKGQARFLKALELTLGIVEKALRIAGVSKRTVYEWRKKYPEFKESWDLILKEQLIDLKMEFCKRELGSLSSGELNRLITRYDSKP